MVRKIINGIVNVALALGIVAILGMMLIITYDAIMRYVFKANSTIAYNLSEFYLMPGIVLFGLAYTQRMRGHTRVVFVLRFFNAKITRVLEVVALITAVIVFFLITWQGGLLTQRAILNNEILPGIINWPMYIAYALLPAGGVVMILQLLLDLYDTITGKTDNKNIKDKNIQEELDVRDMDAKYQ